MFFRNIGVIENVFGRILVLEVLLPVELLLLLLAATAFFVHPAAATATVLFWRNFCLDSGKDVFCGLDRNRIFSKLALLIRLEIRGLCLGDGFGCDHFWFSGFQFGSGLNPRGVLLGRFGLSPQFCQPVFVGLNNGLFFGLASRLSCHWNWGWCNGWSLNIALLFQLLHGLSLFTLKVGLDVFLWCDGLFRRRRRSARVLPFALVATATVLLGGIFREGVELLLPATPTTVDW